MRMTNSIYLVTLRKILFHLIKESDEEGVKPKNEPEKPAEKATGKSKDSKTLPLSRKT
jgi:hypothetical protein